MRTVAVVLLTLGTIPASAQYYMNIVQKDGVIVQHLVSDIDSVFFSGYINSEYVDLGLGVKWATCNVGATKPEEYGDYFAWGETTPYYKAGYAQEDPQAHWKDNKSKGYLWPSYKWCNGSESEPKMTKYCDDSYYGDNGFTDNKTTLDREDDVARVKWGGNWRMPTADEVEDLVYNCIWTWYGKGNSTFNGVAGFKVTSDVEGYEGRFIFLPAAGFRAITHVMSLGEQILYWSSSLDECESNYAVAIDGRANQNGGSGSYTRFWGCCVRPVCP